MTDKDTDEGPQNDFGLESRVRPNLDGEISKRTIGNSEVTWSEPPKVLGERPKLAQFTLAVYLTALATAFAFAFEQVGYVLAVVVFVLIAVSATRPSKRAFHGVSVSRHGIRLLFTHVSGVRARRQAGQAHFPWNEVGKLEVEKVVEEGGATFYARIELTTTAGSFDMPTEAEAQLWVAAASSLHPSRTVVKPLAPS